MQNAHSLWILFIFFGIQLVSCAPKNKAPKVLPEKTSQQETLQLKKALAELKQQEALKQIELAKAKKKKEITKRWKVPTDSQQSPPSTLKFVSIPEEDEFLVLVDYYVKNYWWFFRSIFARKPKYKHLILPILEKEGVSPDIILLAGIESGYRPRALSWAKALGPWQFIPGTGRRYKMYSTPWKEERRHIQKSTRAAAQYLRDLFKMFGKWEFAFAAYNCGEYCVQRSIKLCPNQSFWKMRMDPKCRIPQETREYVLRFFLLLHVQRHPPKKYFQIKKKDPILFSSVRLPRPVNLIHLAKVLRVKPKELHFWNPELSSWSTPPNEKHYELFVDPQYVSRLNRYLQKKRPSFYLQEYSVRNFYELKKLARRYSLSYPFLRALNHLVKTKKIKRKTRILVPVFRNHRTRQKELRKLKKDLLAFLPNIIRGLPEYQKMKLCYTVKDGDSFWSIGKKTGIYFKDIQKYNRGNRYLKKGEVVRLNPKIRCGKSSSSYSYKKSKKSKHSKRSKKSKKSKKSKHSKRSKRRKKKKCHQIQKGESLWRIAQKNDVSYLELKEWNKKQKKLLPGLYIRLQKRARCPKGKRIY